MSSYIVYTDGAYSNTRNQGGIGFVILKDISTPSEVTIISDSQYVVCTYTKNWKRKANLDLWKRFDAAIAFHTKVEFLWTKGHADDQYNKICDKLAQEASKTIEITN